ncbi:MAG: MBL fold metallo-hydrolase [Methanotrichaceae archaeon]
MNAAKRHPHAVLLKPGSLVRDERGEILDARSSVLLIVSESRNIIVDTGLAGEEKIILDRLDDQGKSPQDIDIVVNTHTHPDHCGNNHLFACAQVISYKKQSSVREGYVIVPGVWIMETPGHTLDSISVVCESQMRIIIAGDALPTIGNYLKWVPPRLHMDRNLSLKSMSRIVQLADVIVPGHDSPFSVKERRYISSQNCGFLS